MKKLIFRKFNFDVLKFFITSILSVSIIVWIIQAVNFLDLISEDGHSLKVYFFYTLFSLPKIISKILPFILLISLFFVIIKYEDNNELIIYWINGITKINFVHQIIKLTIYFLIFQLILNLIIVPYTLDKARSYFRNSDVDLISTIIKEKKFIDSIEKLTIFVEKKVDKNLQNIFIKEEISEENSQIIIAQSGYFQRDENKNKIILINGKIIDTNETNQNIIDFTKFNLDLSKFQSNTITNPKTQEMSSLNLFRCILKVQSFIKSNNTIITNSFFPGCDVKIYDALYEEFMKRFLSPFFILTIGSIACLILNANKQKKGFKNFNVYKFFLGIFIILISEISLKHLATNEKLMIMYLLIPISIFGIIYYYIFLKHNNYKIKI